MADLEVSAGISTSSRHDQAHWICIKVEIEHAWSSVGTIKYRNRYQFEIQNAGELACRAPIHSFLKIFSVYFLRSSSLEHRKHHLADDDYRRKTESVWGWRRLFQRRRSRPRNRTKSRMWRTAGDVESEDMTKKVTDETPPVSQSFMVDGPRMMSVGRAICLISYDCITIITSGSVKLILCITFCICCVLLS